MITIKEVNSKNELLRFIKFPFKLYKNSKFWVPPIIDHEIENFDSEKNPNIKVVSNQAADWDSTKARAITETTLQQHPDLCGIVGFWDGMDIGTGAAVKEAGMHEKVFLATSGGGGKNGCDNLKNDIFDVFVSYDVPGQARDLSNVLKRLLQSSNKPGKAGKVSLFTQLQTLTKENMASYMGSGACWTVESLASN